MKINYSNKILKLILVINYKDKKKIDDYKVTDIDENFREGDGTPYVLLYEKETVEGKSILF